MNGVPATHLRYAVQHLSFGGWKAELELLSSGWNNMWAANGGPFTFPIDIQVDFNHHLCHLTCFLISILKAILWS